MRKSAAKGGDYTYFVPDVAYHVTKWERGIVARSTCRARIITAHHACTRWLQALERGSCGYPD
jgi:arginyl-tRNA synthetase